MTDEFFSILAHFCVQMIWKTAANLWKTSSYPPDSILFYEAFFGVVTQHSSVA